MKDLDKKEVYSLESYSKMKTVDQVVEKVEQAQRIFDAKKELDEAKKELSKICIKSFTKWQAKVIVDARSFENSGEKTVNFNIGIKTLSELLLKRVDDAEKRFQKLLSEF